MGFSNLFGVGAPSSGNRAGKGTAAEAATTEAAGKSGKKESTKKIPSSTSAESLQPTRPSTSSQESRMPDTALEHIADESDLRPVDPPPPDLRELNACLDALAAVFPDVQIEVFRDMFASFDGESRLAVVADALLKNRASWVKGRWKVPAVDAAGSNNNGGEEGGGKTGAGTGADARAGGGLVPIKETFRSAEYKRAVKSLAYHEFKGLSRSAIHAVLAEHNYSYLDARQTLVDLSSKSWRFTLSSLFLRRRPVLATEAESHPLVVWKSTGRGSIVPTIKPTSSAELDRELFAALITPLTERAQAARDASDRQLAMELNNAEAEQAGSMIECACCFTESAFEEFVSCTGDAAHMVCFRCVQHCISEAIFGQGWQHNINKETGSLRCPALESTTCGGFVAPYHIHRAMLQEKNGAEVMRQFEHRLADHNLAASGLPLIRCPFCAYAEVDDIYMPVDEWDLLLPTWSIKAVCVACLWLSVCLVLLVFFVYLIIPLVIFGLIFYSDRNIPEEFRDAIRRRRRRRRGLRFDCQNPDCGRPSCIGCEKAWVDVHVCNESSLVALRTQVEQAMSMAVKRVCPRCNTSFVKNSGCNKMTCPCGYQMCYVCRKDISANSGEVGYQHFCNHFRPNGDANKQCAECNKCNLWGIESDDEVMRKAKEEAERKWSETEKKEGLSAAEVRYIETGLATSQSAAGGMETAVRQGRMPTIAEVCDTVVEFLSP
ncbi:hypothetical protein B0J18DRAFT_416345 [Chaetomium sp. MPI-SDFR-AT-0129]|nr:hypothetical protein B0J18DRAFT_416345 [Chaetomium sp. MPI-SDFR-AT-0129]